MTAQETKKLMAIIMAMYPTFQPKNPQETLNAWSWALGPYDFQEIQKGLQVFIRSDTSGFAPTVGQLIGKAQETLSGELSDGEAWGMVVLALRNGIYGAEEEFSKLPPAVQKAVGSPQSIAIWAQWSESMLTGAEASFKRAYKTEVTRCRAQASIGGPVKITGSGAQRPIEARNEPERIELSPAPKKADLEDVERRVEAMWAERDKKGE